jgi:hypothetical protein
MGLTLPHALTEPLGWIGLTWPEADEELLYHAGQAWIDYGTQLQKIAEAADKAAERLVSANSGDAIEAFKKWWESENGPRRRLQEDATAAQIIGAALITFAGATLALKIAFIAQLGILAFEVAQALATAVATFGATTAEIPGFIAATRAICRQLIKQVVTHIQTVIRDILKQAKNLLKKTEKTLAGSAEKRAVKRFEDKLANDLRKVNPKFKPPDPAYSANCTHVVQAFEMRRRGMDVEATALPKKFWPNGGRPLSDVETAWGRTFKPATQTEIEQAFKQAGPGSRGVVYIKWNGPGAHVFNVENVGGKVRFVDGQNGAADVANYFTRGGSTQFIRLDNATPKNVTEFMTK